MISDIEKYLICALALLVVCLLIVFAWLIYKRCVANRNTRENQGAIRSDDRRKNAEQDKLLASTTPSEHFSVPTFEDVERSADQTQGKFIHSSVLEKFCGENPEEVDCEHPIFLHLINSEAPENGIPKYIYQQHHDAIKCALEEGYDYYDCSVMANSSVGQDKQIKARVVYGSFFNSYVEVDALKNILYRSWSSIAALGANGALGDVSGFLRYVKEPQCVLYVPIVKRRSDDPPLKHSMTAFAEAVARAFECGPDGNPSPKLLRHLGIKGVVFCAESQEELSIFHAEVIKSAGTNHALGTDIRERMDFASLYRAKIDGYSELTTHLHAVQGEVLTVLSNTEAEPQQEPKVNK